MGEARGPTCRQSEAIANLREALTNHQPIAQLREPRRRSRRRRRRNRQRQFKVQGSRLKESVPGSAAKPVTQERFHLSRWLWTPLLLLGLMTTGGAGLTALQWLLQPPPVPNCRALSPLAAPAKRLHCAQQLAAGRNPSHLVASINVVKDWGPSHPLYQDSQAVLADWSTALLEQAEEVLDRSGLKPAIELVRHIPASSSRYDAAQATIEDWQQQWAEGDRIYQAALTALAQQDWTLASQQVSALGQLASPYWNQARANALSLRIIDEQQGRQSLTEAKEIAADNSPDQQAAALIQLEAIAPQTLVWEEAKPLQQRWSQGVMAAAVAELEAGRIDRAVELAQALPATILSSESFDIPASAVDLIRYSHAQRLVAEGTDQPPSWWQLTEAIAAAQMLSPQSEFSERIQAQLSQWREQRTAMAQLQLLQATAGTGQRWLLEFSVDQAATVSAQSPQQAQAKALASSWQVALAQIEGRPYFTLAQRTAQAGTLESFKAAIRITEPLLDSGTAWPQVQQTVAGWRSQIQSIEDRPVLIRAQKYAADGDFWDAIKEAQTIADGRALHGEAQSLVGEWQGTIREGEDRNRLEEARQLAANQQLSRAIELAQAIAPRSDVHSTAQSAIAQWQQERDAIWVSQRRQRGPEDSSNAAPSTPSNSPEEVSSDPPPEPPADESYGSPYYGYYGTDE